MLRIWTGTFLLLCTLSCSLIQADEKPTPHWSGLLFKDAAKIPGRVEKKLPNGPFSCGVITDAKTFASLTQTLSKGTGKPAPHWADWEKNIDWKKEVVAYVILNLQTNRLTYASCEPCKGGSTLTVRWSGIEPFYNDAYPAVFTRVPRLELQRMKFVVDAMELAEVPLEK